MPSAKPLRPHQATMLGAGAVSLILWATPVFGLLLLPLQYLNTHLHELCHALAALASGGSVGRIEVFANGSGVTLASGLAIVVNPAGYLGATIVGGLMIAFGRSERGAATTLRVVGAALAISLLLWVRGDAVGLISGVFWIGALFGLPHLLTGRQLVFTTQLLGMQQCLASVQALYVLFRVSAYPGMESDASNMARASGIPAIVWAVLWGALGIGVLWFTLRSAWNRSPRG